MRFTYKYRRVELSTGIFIPQDHWDESKQHIKDKIPGARVLNDQLDKMKIEIQDMFVIDYYLNSIL